MTLHIFLAIFVIILPDMICSEKAEGADILASYKRNHQLKNGDNDHSDHLYINLKLDEILETMKETRNPADDQMHEATEQLEQRFENVLRELKDIKEDLTNVKEDLTENRQYTNSKCHELNQDVNDFYDNTNAKHHGLRQDLTDMDAKFKHFQQSVKESTKLSGTTYIRWGRTECPKNGSEVVFNGWAGGSWYDHTGAAASMLCLPEEPDWDRGKYNDVPESYLGYVYGAEYQDGERKSDQLFGRSHFQQNPPCVMCNVRSRTSHIMIPGKTRCPAGWTTEYYGYLMSGGHSRRAASDYYCIDMKPEDVPGGEKNENGYLLYFVESRCGSLRCPPYVNGRELQCVVCTK